jgi:putative transposase
MRTGAIIELSTREQEDFISELRQARYGHLLAIHILLLLDAGKNPTEISEVLFCSRTSVYRTMRAYRGGELGWQLESDENQAALPRLNRWQRKLRFLIKQSPRLFGWCRVRWSCATLALTLATILEISVSRETIRRQLKVAGYEWKRAKLSARDDDPERIRRLARIRQIIEQLRPGELILFADELDIELLPKVGYQWMLKGTQLEIPTPGKNQKHYLAGALDPWTGQLYYVLGPRKNNVLFRQLLNLLESQMGKRYTKVYIVVDNYSIHKAKAVDQWVAFHPHFELVFLPSYCPRANPIERAFGDVHDKCTRNHTRKRLSTLIRDVEGHLVVNGPWQYQLSEIYYTHEVDAALNRLYLEATYKVAA